MPSGLYTFFAVMLFPSMFLNTATDVILVSLNGADVDPAGDGAVNVDPAGDGTVNGAPI